MKKHTITGSQYDALLAFYCSYGSGKIHYLKEDRAAFTASGIPRHVQTIVINQASNKTLDFLHTVLSNNNITITL